MSDIAIESTSNEPIDSSNGNRKRKRDHKSKGSKRARREEKAQLMEKTEAVPVVAQPSVPAPAPSPIDKYLSKNITDLESFRKEHNITVSGPLENITAYKSFTETGFPEVLLRSTQKFSRPTAIQSQCWPILQAHRDVIGIAQTGSGKTLAFGLPGLETLLSSPSKSKTRNPRILVLAPTRELALQTVDILKPIGQEAGIFVEAIFGGVPRDAQIRAMKKGVDVVVATPGRLLDLVNDGACLLGEVEYLVLDEADRMLDMGFEKDIRTIIGCTPDKSKRQTAMFSATWPLSIQKLASEFLADPIKVTVGTLSEGMSSNANVKQIVEVLESDQRNDRLKALLKEYHKSGQNRILIFVLYKKETFFVENFIRRNGWNVASISSDKSQSQRLNSLNAFKSGEVPLLVATDVAARGLDIPKVEYVINYSFPLTIEDYVHRIGRTGRAGATGVSHTFFQQCDKQRAGELALFLRESNQTVPESLGKWGLAIKKKEPKLGKIDLGQQSTGHITFDSDEE
eukprot:TRINITY_DN1087_c0_g1_i1.p1 TRINITY_DN1087_c0_g1~~TRINITY_DN1087_c0_g1_i1.p1  ORF type:complete len:513 (+),score=109.16 TRINITY_DN1087_c0_g1_i1:95-1633(+)